MTGARVEHTRRPRCFGLWASDLRRMGETGRAGLAAKPESADPNFSERPVLAPFSSAAKEPENRPQFQQKEGKIASLGTFHAYNGVRCGLAIARLSIRVFGGNKRGPRTRQIHDGKSLV